MLKSGEVVRLDDIPSLFKDSFALTAIKFYERWKRMGFPWVNWGDCPNQLVEVVDILEPIDRLYNPPRRVF